LLSLSENLLSIGVKIDGLEGISDNGKVYENRDGELWEVVDHSKEMWRGF